MPVRQDEMCDLAEDRKILPLRTAQLEPIEEREHPCLKIGRLGHFKVEDTVAAASDRSGAEDLTEKPRGFLADLRHVERQRDPPWQATITLSTDWDIEASLSVDESRHPITQVAWDSIKPVCGTGPFLLIVRTGRIVTARGRTLRRGCDRETSTDRILGVSSI